VLATVVVAVLITIGVILVMIGLAHVQRRRETPLVFQCKRCATEFAQPPHRDYPHACPHCHATDWSS
jgi:hypothetical protein